MIAAEALDAFDRVVTYRVGQAIRCWQAERPGDRYDLLPGGTDHELNMIALRAIALLCLPPKLRAPALRRMQTAR